MALSQITNGDQMSVVLTKINDAITAIDAVSGAGTIRGSSTFNTTSGRAITHDLGTTSFVITITPTANPNGTIGEVWVAKTTSTVTVYNSGSFTGAFDYVIFYTPST